MDSLTRRYERSVELKSRRISSMAIIFPVQRNPAAGVSADRYRMASNPARIEPDGHGRRRFRSTLDILVRDSSACHERRGKPRRTRMSIVRSLSSTPTTLRHQATAAAVVAPLHPFVPPPNGSAHLSCAASGDLPDGELRARRKPLPS